MILNPASSVRAFRSFRFVVTMSMTCLRVTLPTLVLFGSLEPAAMLAAFFNKTAAGGLLVMNVNDLSLKTVLRPARMSPAGVWMAAVHAFQRELILTRRERRAIQT